QLGVWKRCQKTNHRQGNCTVANKVDLPLEDVFRIMIKSDNEPSHHFHSITLDLLYRLQQVAAILSLLCFFQTLFDWRFDAEEHGAESRIAHRVEQRIVV